MVERENQRVIMSKRLLKEGLLRMLKTQMLDDVSVSALCRESGINRATFYRHYDSPRDVLVELEMEMIREASRNRQMPGTQREALRYLEDICNYLYENKELVKVLIHAKSDEDLSGILREFNQKTWEERDELGADRDLDQDTLGLISTFMYTGSYYLIRRWLTWDVNKTPGEVAALLYQLVNRNTKLY